MTTFTIHTPATAPEGSREPLRELERRLGFIPNLAATIGGAPAAIAGFGGLQAALRGTALTAAEREVIGIAVSRENDCEYSLAAHSVFALNAGVAADDVAALRSGEPVADARRRALQQLAQALVRERGHVESDLSPEDVLETIAQVAYTTFANLAANAARTPVDEAFAARAAV